MRLVDLDTKVTTWRYNFDKEEYVAVQTTVGEMIDLNTHEGLSIPTVEIPEPHGRLIDADALHNAIAANIIGSRCGEETSVEIAINEAIIDDLMIIDAAPTVIPASEEIN